MRACCLRMLVFLPGLRVWLECERITKVMEQMSLFGDLVIEAPSTQGVKYAGSKLKLISHILQLAKRVDATTILDGFAGATRVSQAFAKRGYRVLSNDIAVWSEVFGTCYLLNEKKPKDYKDLIDHLNAIPPTDGWFTKNYGGEANGGCANSGP